MKNSALQKRCEKKIWYYVEEAICTSTLIYERRSFLLASLTYKSLLQAHFSFSLQLIFRTNFLSKCQIQAIMLLIEMLLIECSLFNFEVILGVECCTAFVDRTPIFRADHPFMYFILGSKNATQILAGNFKQWKSEIRFYSIGLQ